MYLVFDCETTGIKNARLVQLAWQLHDAKGQLLAHGSDIVRPEGFEIPLAAEQIHGISTERALREGVDAKQVLEQFALIARQAQHVVGHNIVYDLQIMETEQRIHGLSKCLEGLSVRDTMKEEEPIAFVAIPTPSGAHKWPKLNELYEKVFGKAMPKAHDAAFDVAATAAAFFELLAKGVMSPSVELKKEEISYQAPPFFSEAQKKAESTKTPPEPAVAAPTPPASSVQLAELKKLPFAHLHVHSQHSVIPGLLRTEEVVSLAQQAGFAAAVLMDMGNLCGAFSFVQQANKLGIKAIIGCEFFLSTARTQHRFTREQPDRRYRQPMLAKTKTGFYNLSKLSSIGYAEGLYGLYPRIDKELLANHKEGLVALSGNRWGILAQHFFRQGKQKAEEELKWWMDTFGKDFYLEIQRTRPLDDTLATESFMQNHLQAEERFNDLLLDWGTRYDVAFLPVQEVFYGTPKDAEGHDILLCIKDQLLKRSPVGDRRGQRPAIVAEAHHFCSAADMHASFADLPEGFHHLGALINSIETYELKRKVQLPKASLPDGFTDEAAYLNHLATQGMAKRYSTINETLESRLEKELQVINKAGYAGYFLIVHEIVSQARRMGVAVGPGRGSVAGSLVAYVLEITQVDPLLYGLLFERFLNPERISMPDIDMDFDDERRDDLIQWILSRYGTEQVAQIITYGTLAGRSAIRDCARVLEMPLDQADRLAKAVPFSLGYSLAEAIKREEIQSLQKENPLAQKVLSHALSLEGAIRNVGTHACGLIIAPQPLTDLVPLMRTKDSVLATTQFDNEVIEEAGLLKMDILGLRTLSILRSALAEINTYWKKTLDLANLPLDDAKAYQLFQRAQTTGIFQFESSGMQRHLKSLKPDRFEDLVAMNALYRPGPMAYIPQFVARKHGKEPIHYDVPEMEDILAETYGVTVYQEQVMLLSERLAGFTKAQSDTLRYAMGKKVRRVLDELKPQFIVGFQQRGHDKALGEKIWSDWQAFASYAFNKSHAVCYALLAYQAAYLRAHYPAAYLAALLSHQQSSLDRIRALSEECRQADILLMPPQVNTSEVQFSVQDAKTITFGLMSIKGVGLAIAEAIVASRKKDGPFKDLFDFACRLSSVSLNKATYESLARGGAFDNLGGAHRRQFLEAPEGQRNGIELALRYAQHKSGEHKAQRSLYEDQDRVAVPRFIDLAPYTNKERLAMEKDYAGTYLSGHPLDVLGQRILPLANVSLNQLSDLESLVKGRTYRFFACITDLSQRLTQSKAPYTRLSLEDRYGAHEITLWRSMHMQFQGRLHQESLVLVEGKVTRLSYGRKELSFEPSRLLLLPDQLPELLPTLSLVVHATEASPVQLEALEQALQKAPPGRTLLQLIIQEGPRHVVTTCHKYPIKASVQLIEDLDSLSKMQLRLPSLHPQRVG